MKAPFFIAEMSCSHLGSFDRAIDIIKAAAVAGASGVKIQLWKPDTMCIDPSYHIQSGPWAGRELADLYREAQTEWEWVPELFAAIRNLGMTPIASPFDAESVDYLEQCGCDIYKIASFEIVDLPLINYVAKTGKPLIISTGMATLDETRAAVHAARSVADAEDVHAVDITLLHCISSYPAKPEDMNMATMQALGRLGRFGLSDHSLDATAAIIATAMGATIIEKHLTLNRADGGPDAGFSLEPAEFAKMVQACRQAAACVGTVKHGPSESEASSLALRRSLYISQDLKAGDVLTLDNVQTARPAMGLSPVELHNVTGSRVKIDVSRGTPITWEMLHGTDPH